MVRGQFRPVQTRSTVQEDTFTKSHFLDRTGNLAE